MFKKKNNKKRSSRFSLPEQTKQWIFGVLLTAIAIVISLSFFNKAGVAGEYFLIGSNFLIGKSIFLIPFVLMLGGIVLLTAKHGFNLFEEKRILWPIVLAIIIFIIGITGILGSFSPLLKRGGILGYAISFPFLKYFGFWATLVIFLAPIAIGLLIFWQFLRPEKIARQELDKEKVEIAKKPSIIKKIFSPSFKVKEITTESPILKSVEKQAPPPLKLEKKTLSGVKISPYQPPPLDLLERQKGAPTSGDTGVNSAIIKKTLQNFGIDVAMSEINIGPTVTQYTLKPAEGVKLTKITSLNNDLALALASHPIRIEAPIPGRSLIGIEMPNKVRAQVRLRELIEHQNFQRSPGSLMIALGSDVSGNPTYTDLARMPHMLVAGSTGSGKTIFLNTLILSLLYQPSNHIKSPGPDFLRLILVDPKRVEFPVYENLPHLLCPVIYNASQTVNALKWLTGEMERRFDVLAAAKARDIRSFNEIAFNEGTEPLPFIVLVIDELADLMAAKGREIEAGIVRLAQMARAVGIHLVVATQRPSVEVITGLIKANITSRVTFQVASQVDSRTVLDSAGAEKLLGAGDMLYVSVETTKPKRIQAPYASDKEVKRVIAYIASKREDYKVEMDEELIARLDTSLDPEEGGSYSPTTFEGDDPLYEEAKKLIIESKKASASLLQRRLRVGYARAARLIDILEQKGVVGPADGAKAREILGDSDHIPVPVEEQVEEEKQEEDKADDGWQKL